MRGLRIHFPAILLSFIGGLIGFLIMREVMGAEKGDASFYVVWTGLTLAVLFLLSFVGMYIGLRFFGKYRVDMPQGWHKWALLALLCLFLLGCIGQYLYGGKKSSTQTVQSDADVVLLIDASGSMDGRSMTAAKDAASQFVDILNTNTRLQLVSFAARVLDDTGLVTMDATGRSNAKTFIYSIDSTGGTDFDSALQCAIDSINNYGRTNAKPIVILMTDGLDYVEDAVKNQYYSAGVPVYTVQICDTAGDYDLIQFANRSGGFDTQIDPSAVDATSLLDGFRNALNDTVSVSYEDDALLLNDDASSAEYRHILRWLVMCLSYVICAVGLYGKPSKRGLLIRLVVGAVLGLFLSFASYYDSVVPLYVLLISTAYVLVRPSAEVEINV